MRKTLKTSAAALVMASLSVNAWAAPAASCARPEDLNAVKTAAVQQKLMVAALYCDAAPQYNSFVTAYQKDLQNSDRSLEKFFKRVSGRASDKQYNAFKTKLANASSMQVIQDKASYCAGAQEAFAVAFASANSDLGVFVASQHAAMEDAFQPCSVLTAENAGGSRKAPVAAPTR